MVTVEPVVEKPPATNTCPFECVAPGDLTGDSTYEVLDIPRKGGVLAAAGSTSNAEINPVANAARVSEGKFMPPILARLTIIIEAYFLCIRFGDRRFAGAGRCVLQDLLELITRLAGRAITSQQVLRKVFARGLLINLEVRR